jgi:adenylate cyclase
MAHGATLSGIGAGGEAGPSGAPSAEAIRAQVHHIASSEGFARSERLKRFLGYIVEETLAGRGNQIKAYTIAMGVCDRDERFDSRLDPIVRIEAGRLRRALQHYYLTVGRADPIVIDMPKGGYHPSFSQRPVDPVAPAAEIPSVPSAVPALAVPDEHEGTWFGLLWPWRRAALLRAATIAAAVLVLAGAWLQYELRRPAVQELAATAPAAAPRQKMPMTRGPWVVVLPFENLSGDSAQDYFAQGLNEDLTRHLSQHADLVVRPVALGFAMRGDGASQSPDNPTGVTFVIRGSVRHAVDKVRVSVQLYDAQSSVSLWSQTYDRIQSVENFVELQDEIARALVTKLTGSMGVITQSMLARLASGNFPEGLGTYECTLRQYRFWRTWEAADHLALRACLERAVADYPDYARGWSALTYVYLDEYRHGYGGGNGETEHLRRAVAAARRAVELDRASVPAREALSISLYYARDFARSFAISDALTEQYPTDLAMAARIARRIAFAGDGRWQEGMARFYEVKARTPNPPGWYFAISALDAYRRGDDLKALTEAQQVDSSGFILRPMVLTMIYGQLGMQAEAQSALDELRRLAPRFVDDPRKWVSRVTFDPELFVRMMDGLRKAGLNLTPRYEEADR